VPLLNTQNCFTLMLPVFTIAPFIHTIIKNSLTVERLTEGSRARENYILFPPPISYRTCRACHFGLGFPLFLAKLGFCVDGDSRRRLAISSHFSVGFFFTDSMIFSPSWSAPFALQGATWQATVRALCTRNNTRKTWITTHKNESRKN
jgi:hypothetical protein